MATLNPLSTVGTTAVVLQSDLNDDWTYMAGSGHYRTADLLAALDATANADAEAKLIEQYRRADKAEAKLADAERTLTELAPARDERVIAWDAIAKHEAFQPCYDEGRPLLNAVVDRIGALLDAEAERDAHAAVIGRVREAVAELGAESENARLAAIGLADNAWSRLTGQQFALHDAAEAVRAALDPKPAFVLPTEAGISFTAKNGIGEEVTFCSVWNITKDGDSVLYVNNRDYLYNGDDVLKIFTDHRLLDNNGTGPITAEDLEGLDSADVRGAQ